MSALNYMGVDAAFSNIGWVVADPFTLDLRGFGVLRTSRTKPKVRKAQSISIAEDDVTRIRLLVAGLKEIVEREDVGGMAVELPMGGSQSAISTKALGMATAVLTAAAFYMQIPMIAISPYDSKLAIGGSKQSSKEEVAEAVYEQWPQLHDYRPEGLQEHITDAGAAFLCTRWSDVYHRLYLRRAKQEAMRWTTKR